jgi:dimeric dUTPase (all-alpha-NTP-PPase superfamily)
MNVSHLFAIQQALDERILVEHGLEGSDLFVKKIIALHVELGELANETRSFKYWSKKGPSPRETILEEYVDVLHFTLSLGIDLGCTDLSAERPAASARRDLTEQFACLLTAIAALAANRAAADYRTLFAELLALGGLLGFTAEEIERAYLQKNEKNHQRQTEGY